MLGFIVTKYVLEKQYRRAMARMQCEFRVKDGYRNLEIQTPIQKQLRPRHEFPAWCRNWAKGRCETYSVL